MNRQLVLAAGALSITQQTTAPIQISRSLSSRTNTQNPNGLGKFSSVGEWLAAFINNAETVPSSIAETKHDPSCHRKPSRTSPKLRCRAPIDALRNYVPQDVLERLQQSSHYVRSSDAIVTTSDKSPSTNGNRHDCIKKLHKIIQEIAKDAVTATSRQPPRQLPRSPPSKLSAAEARKRFMERKRLERKAKVNEQIARAQEEARKARGGRN